MTESDSPQRNGRPPVPDPTVQTTALVDRAIGSFREVMETRLAGIDRATELVAADLTQARSDTDVSQRRLLGTLTGDINALRELLTARLEAMDKATELLANTVGKVPSDTDKAVDALRQLLGARIDGMDTATKLLAANVAEFPSDLDKATRALREILSGEIRNVQGVSAEKFSAIEGTFASNALALTAALAAQKEAAAESVKSSTLAIDRANAATKETIAANASQTEAALTAQASNIGDLKERVVRLESGGVATATARTEQRADRGNSLTTAQAVIAAILVVVAIAALIAPHIH